MVAKIFRPGSVPLLRPQCVGGDIVFIDGMSCSGKSLLAPLISTLRHGELWQINYMYDFLCILDCLGQIERKSAAGIVRTLCDLDVYNAMIARGTNFRRTDMSGAWENLLEARYRERLQAPDGDSVVQRIRKKSPILPLMVHYSFAQSKLLFDALGERLKLYIVTVRHPLWLFDAWHKARWDRREGKDPRHFRLCCRVGNKIVPWFAASWADEYLCLKSVDRSVRVVEHFIRVFQRQWNAYPPAVRKRVRFIPFEKFSPVPMDYLDPIASALRTYKTTLTKSMLKKLRLPRSFYPDDLTQKRVEIDLTLAKERASDRSREILENLSSDYERTYLRT